MSSHPNPADTPAPILGLGVVVVDLLAMLEAYPHPDTKQDVQTSLIQVGGPVPTALVQLATFGHRCHLIGRWGDDPLGKVIEADLRSVGIAFDSRCRQADLTTSHSQVWIDAGTGQRTSVTQRCDADGLTLSESDRTALQSARLLHLDGWPSKLALQAARIAKAAGAIVAVDTGSPKPGIDDLLRIADVVNAPRRFVEQHLGTSDIAAGAEQIASLGPRLVTVTDGEHGAVMHVHGESLQTAALDLSGGGRGWSDVRSEAPVRGDATTPRCIDNNGAGDVFSGAIVHGVLAGWPPAETLKFAAAAAGLKCGRLGNRAALADEPAVREAAGRLT